MNNGSHTGLFLLPGNPEWFRNGHVMRQRLMIPISGIFAENTGKIFVGNILLERSINLVVPIDTILPKNEA